MIVKGIIFLSFFHFLFNEKIICFIFLVTMFNNDLFANIYLYRPKLNLMLIPSLSVLVFFTSKEYILLNIHIATLTVSVGKHTKFMHTLLLFNSYYKLIIALLQNQLKGLSFKELWCIGLNLTTRIYVNESYS